MDKTLPKEIDGRDYWELGGENPLLSQDKRERHCFTQFYKFVLCQWAHVGYTSMAVQYIYAQTFPRHFQVVYNYKNYSMIRLGPLVILKNTYFFLSETAVRQ